MQILKRLFSMTNYKSAPMAVAKLWSLKAARVLTVGARAAWFEDVVIPAGNLITDLTKCAASKVVCMCLQTEKPMAVRMLRGVVRGPEEIALQGWVHVVLGSMTVVGRVEDIVQLSFVSTNAIRVLCCGCQRVDEGSVDDVGRLYISKDPVECDVLFRLEDVMLSVLHCSDVGDRYTRCVQCSSNDMCYYCIVSHVIT